MASCWPAPTPMAPCSCGIPPPASPSAPPPQRRQRFRDAKGVAFSPDGKLLASANPDGTVQLSNPAADQAVGADLPADTGANRGVNDGRSALMGSCWPARTPTARCGCGTRPPASPSAGHFRPTGTASGVPGWRSARTASCWPAPTTMAGYGCGTGHRPGYRFPSPDTALQRRIRSGVQPGRQGAGQRRQRRQGAAVGSGHRPGRRRPSSRQASGGQQRELRWRSARMARCWPTSADGADNGTVRLWRSGHRPGCRLPLRAETAPTERERRGVQPGQQDAGRAYGDGKIRLWNPATGQPVGSPLRRTPGNGTGVAFSPDSKMLAAYEDGKIRLWNPATGQPVGSPLLTGADLAGADWRSAPTADAGHRRRRRQRADVESRYSRILMRHCALTSAHPQRRTGSSTCGRTGAQGLRIDL